MPRFPRPLVLLLLTTTSCVALLSACTSSPSGTASPSAAPTSAASPSAATSSSASSSASASQSSPAAADAVTIDITIKDHQVSPNGDKINVIKGQTVLLKVTSDTDDEIHAHTSGDGYELEVKAGTPATGQFVAFDTGSFEVESHHLEKVIAILVVR